MRYGWDLLGVHEVGVGGHCLHFLDALVLQRLLLVASFRLIAHQV